MLNGLGVSTARKVSEASSEQTTSRILCQRLREVFDEFPEPVLIAENGGLTVHLNATARCLAGADQKLDIRRMNGEPFPESELPLATALRDQHKFPPTQLMIRNPDGKDVPYIASALPVADMVVALFQEASGLKPIEKLRDLWVADVAQALRYPITRSIAGLEEVEKSSASGVDPQTKRQELQKVRVILEGIVRVISDLEQFSRIDARHLELHCRPTDLKAVLNTTISRLVRVTEGHPIIMTFHGPDRTVFADPMRLEHILANLLSNAIEYGDYGSPVEIEAIFKNNEVIVSVTNTGRGIPPENLPRVFESRFTRSLRRKNLGLPGLGLGLYVTRGLVEAHGGKIWVESEMGRKTTFSFSLPTE